MERNKNGQFARGNFKDYTGVKKGMLTFVEFDHVHTSPSGHRRPYWKLKCNCGALVIASARDVISGHTKSCGCLQKSATSKAKRIHGESDTRLYYIWENMRKRCYNKRNEKYKTYGARGIKVCDEWKYSYKNFSEWAKSTGYKEHLTIERVDVNKGYEPDNCEWIPVKEQAKNKTNSIRIKINDVTYSPEELSKKYSIPIKTIYARISRGDEGEDIVRPLGKRRFYKKITPR